MPLVASFTICPLRRNPNTSLTWRMANTTGTGPLAGVYLEGVSGTGLKSITSPVSHIPLFICLSISRPDPTADIQSEFDGYHERNHPDVIEQNIHEIEEFARSLHTNVLDPLHVLVALALELPEDYFTNLHKYSDPSEDHLRYMMYRHFSPEETKIIESNDGLYTLGHTDLGTLTLLFRQPVAALQIRDHETGNWKWAKPLDGSLTVNTCDALSFLTGGYIKSTVHRVSNLLTQFRVPELTQRFR